MSCISALPIWMNENRLKLNDSKTEFMVLSTKHRLNKIKTTSISVGDAKIPSCKEVRNIGAMFDPELSMSTQVKKLCRGAWINLHNIEKIQSYQNKTKTAVHAYVPWIVVNVLT